MMYYLALAGGVLFGVCGQVALKSGAEGSATLVQQFTNPLTILGFGVYGIAGLLYAVAIKEIPVSVAFPSVAASYIIVAVLANLFWGEPLGLRQLLGIFLIGGGLLVLHTR